MITFKEFCTQLDEAAWTKKTANDPDSRINKLLRKWDC